jgi:hypothetical protein
MTGNNHNQTTFFDRNDVKTTQFIIALYYPGEENGSGASATLLLQTFSRRVIPIVLPSIQEKYPKVQIIVANGRKAFEDIFALANGPIPSIYIPVSEQEFNDEVFGRKAPRAKTIKAPKATKEITYEPNDKAKRRRKALLKIIAKNGKEAARKVIEDFEKVYTQDGAKTTTLKKFDEDLIFVNEQA